MDLTDSFLDYLLYERNYSLETIKSYREDMLQFEVFLAKESGKERSLAEVGAKDIRAWVVDLMDQGRASTTVNRKLSTLHSFYRFLLKRNICQVNPSRKVTGPKNKKKLPVFVKEAEMDRLLDDVDFGEGFEACRDRVLIETLYLTGIRLAELIGLKDEDVDFASSQLKVTGKRNKQRLVPFGEELKKDLQEYVKLRDETVVGGAKAFFVRKSGEQVALIVVNFSDVDAHVGVRIPKHALDFLQIAEGNRIATELMSGNNVAMTVASDQYAYADVPALSAAILVFKDK